MTTPSDNKQLLTRYVAALRAGDQQRIRDTFSEDARWTLRAGELPISGTWTGRDAIIDDFLGKALQYYEPESIDIAVTDMLADEDRVVLQWTTRARTRGGRQYENDCIAVFTIKDGKIQDVREYMDTLYAYERAFSASAAP